MNEVRDMLERTLQELYFMEKRLVAELPRLAEQADEPLLVDALQRHVEVSNEQVVRLESMLTSINGQVVEAKVESFVMLFQEGMAKIELARNDTLRDFSVATLAQKTDHYEIGGYQSAVTLAVLGAFTEVSNLLLTSLGEEMAALSEVTVISGSFIARGTVGGSEPLRLES